MDLLPLRCYGLIFATGRTFPLPCCRALVSPGGGIGNPALSVSHQAIQIPSTDSGGLGIRERGV